MIGYYKSGFLIEQAYAANIVEDQGFAETFDAEGNFLKTNIYKSIRITGWVLQYEHAAQRIRRLKAAESKTSNKL